MTRRFIFAIAALATASLLFTAVTQKTTETPTKQIIRTPHAPAAIGPYSQAVQVGNMLFCSGQIAIDPKTGTLVTENVEAETRRVLDNLGAILKAAGMDYSDVVKATVYLKDLNHYSAVNSVYATYFKENPPAREAVQVARLPKDAHVEISLVAVKAR